MHGQNDPNRDRAIETLLSCAPLPARRLSERFEYATERLKHLEQAPTSQSAGRRQNDPIATERLKHVGRKILAGESRQNDPNRDREGWTKRKR